MHLKTRSALKIHSNVVTTVTFKSDGAKQYYMSVYLVWVTHFHGDAAKFTTSALYLSKGDMEVGYGVLSFKICKHTSAVEGVWRTSIHNLEVNFESTTAFIAT